MLSYQHGYHAGGPADVHKHLALAGFLALLTVKDRGISYLESHAGRGLYDLAAPEAGKTGEAARGIGRLAPGGHPFWGALAAIRARHGATAYPGSPLLARTMLRPVDRLTLAELHPAEHAGLREATRGQGAPVAVHRRDGAEMLRALSPPKPLRGLALVDPSYEVKDEYARTARLARDVARRWPQGVVVVWYPLLPDGRHRALTEAVMAAADGTLRDEALFAEPPARGMVGSGLLVLNPPHGAADVLREAREAGAPVLAAG
jgi:23S rRNA (adenine2030-N6)-methyltransferase